MENRTTPLSISLICGFKTKHLNIFRSVGVPLHSIHVHY